MHEVEENSLPPGLNPEPQLRLVPFIAGLAPPGHGLGALFQESESVDRRSIEEAQRHAPVRLGHDVLRPPAFEPWPAGHQIGLFFTNAIHSPDGAPLVASPVSVLLTLTAPLVDSGGHSTVSGVADADAAAMEAGRQALQPLLDNPIFTPLTGVSRANLVYCYAFVPTVMP